MMHVVGVTSNGITVSVDLAHSGAAQLISRRPHLLTFAGEIISGLTLVDSHLVMTYDMGRAIGYDFIVTPTATDVVFYAQLAKENIYIPFTKKGSPTSTNLLTMILCHSEADGYFLDDLWPGPFRPSLPGSASESDDSKAFWESHAYIYEDQHIKVSSVTHDCPY